MVARFSRTICAAKNGLFEYTYSVFRRKIVYFAAFSALLPCSLHAACHAVTPSGAGSKNGTSWSNAYAGLPSTLVRGDIYYLADGSYGTYTFGTSDSGTTTVEIRKAQSYDFGNSCGIGTGWNTGTMGSSQAVFSSGGTVISVSTDYFIMNGNGTSTTAGCGGAPGSTVTSSPPTPIDCGIKLQGTSGNNNIVYMNFSSTHQTFKYIELSASGENSNDLEMFASTGNFTITNSYLHNSGCVYIQDIGDNSLVDHDYFWGTETLGSAAGCHGQAEYEAGGTSNGVRSNNVYRDIVGTAVWTFAAGSGTNNNWQFYDNVIWYTTPAVGWVTGAGFGPLANGILACINSGVFCNNFTLNQNTIVNLMSGGVPGILDENGSTGYVVRNNLWYNDPFGVGFPNNATQDHNSFLVSTTNCPSGATNVCNNTAPNPFTNWPAGNFTLAADSANVNNRASLGSPYNIDAAGLNLTTDRGSYQFNGTSQVQSPTNLSVAVQ
jgi:hypothetical protein